MIAGVMRPHYKKERRTMATTTSKPAEKQTKSKTIKVECIQDYRDLQLDRIVRTGEQLEATEQRAALLLEEKVVRRI